MQAYTLRAKNHRVLLTHDQYLILFNFLQKEFTGEILHFEDHFFDSRNFDLHGHNAVLRLREHQGRFNLSFIIDEDLEERIQYVHLPIQKDDVKIILDQKEIFVPKGALLTAVEKITQERLFYKDKIGNKRFRIFNPHYVIKLDEYTLSNGKKVYQLTVGPKEKFQKQSLEFFTSVLSMCNIHNQDTTNIYRIIFHDLQIAV